MASLLEKAIHEQIHFHYPDSKGVYYRDTLRSVERQVKDPPQVTKDEIYALNNPTFIPPIADRIWDAFWEINKARQSNGFGWAATTNLELKAWCELMNERLDPWEVQMFRLLDETYLSEVHKKTKDNT